MFDRASFKRFSLVKKKSAHVAARPNMYVLMRVLYTKALTKRLSITVNNTLVDALGWNRRSDRSTGLIFMYKYEEDPRELILGFEYTPSPECMDLKYRNAPKGGSVIFEIGPKFVLDLDEYDGLVTKNLVQDMLFVHEKSQVVEITTDNFNAEERILHFRVPDILLEPAKEEPKPAVALNKPTAEIAEKEPALKPTVTAHAPKPNTDTASRVTSNGPSNPPIELTASLTATAKQANVTVSPTSKEDKLLNALVARKLPINSSDIYTDVADIAQTGSDTVRLLLHSGNKVKVPPIVRELVLSTIVLANEGRPLPLPYQNLDRKSLNTLLTAANSFKRELKMEGYQFVLVALSSEETRVLLLHVDDLTVFKSVLPVEIL